MDLDYSSRLIWKNYLHPEIYNSSLPIDQKLFLQNRLENKFEGNLTKLLEDIMWYSAHEVEDYEKCTLIRDYIKKL
jgi:hypothetical protein